MVERHTDTFGYFNRRHTIKFDNCIVQPISDIEESSKWVKSIVHKDGYIYSPITKQYRAERDRETGELNPTEEIPQTERPALYYQVPVSHEISIKNPSTDQPRLGDAGLVIHLLAFMYGTRFQYHDWRIDGRVPIKPCGDIAHDVAGFESVSEKFLSHVYSEWLIWDEKCRFSFVNILCMHSRAISLENEWESFASGYMVFDALYRLHANLGRDAYCTHYKRLPGMLNYYHLAEDKSGLLDSIYRARNELFHEAIWAGESPGHSASQMISFQMHRFNARLIVAITGYDNNYVHFPWWTFGNKLFD
jgi:hypothetical protein